MSAEDVSFYARLKEVQELQHKREQKRIGLQRKFDSSVTSDHHLSRLRASRLQSYWKRVCENERKSRARNEQLLRDFERVEAHMATLSSRTHRLKLLKNQYEQQVEEMYPYWKEQMEIKRQSQMKREHHSASVLVSASVSHGQHSGTAAAQEGAPNFAAQSNLNGTTSIAPGQQYPEASSRVHIPQHSTTLYQQPLSSAQSILPGSYFDFRPSAAIGGQELAKAPQQRTAPSGYFGEASGGALLGAGQVPSSFVAQGTGAAGSYGQAEDSTTFSISSETPSSPSHKQKQGVVTAGSVQSSRPVRSHIHSRDLQPNQGIGEPTVALSKEVERGSLQEHAPPQRSNPALDQDLRRGSATGSLAGASDKPPSALTEPFSSGDEYAEHLGDEAEHALYSPEVPPALPKYEEGEELPAGKIASTAHETVLSVGAAPEVPQVRRPSDLSGTSGSEEDSELDSDVSLPLSDVDAGDAGVKPTSAAERSSSVTKAETRTSDAHQIPLSLNGFWLLLKAVEAEIDETDTLEGIYASLPCTKTIRDEIVRTANSKSGFERLDPRAISMVILEELPLLVRQLPGGCLLSERLLIASSRTITEVSIRSHMYSSALAFWDSILRHMVFLVRRGVMEPEAVARKFAPLLVAAESRATDKAINVMSDILLRAEEEEEELTLGDESSLTATSPMMSPDNPIAASPAAHHGTEGGKPGDHPSVPPLALGGMEGDTDDLVDTGRASTDSFFDSKVPLTETDAYQRMMMSSQPEKGRESLQAAGGDDDDDISDDDDSEDEIERAARIKQDSPSSQQPKKKRNVLSSLGGSLGMSLEDADDDDGDGETSGGRKPLPTDRSDEVSSPDKSDPTSSLSPTPRGAGTVGYVPSAMEQSMKSTGRSDLMNRSAAFWGNESDLEEESDMSVPMGTGKVDDEKDDFDFYD